jgi:Fibronectin type III domain/Protein of unknown function (DUF642)
VQAELYPKSQESSPALLTRKPTKKPTRRPKTLATYLLGIYFILFTATFGVGVRWNPNPENNISHYTVHYGTTPSFPAQQQVVVQAPLTSTIIPNLEPGVTYYFVVTAHNFDGMTSEPSAQISYTPPLDLQFARNVIVEAETGSITPGLQRQSSGLDQWVETQTGDTIGKILLTANIPESNTYEIWCRQKNPAGSSAGNNASIATTMGTTTTLQTVVEPDWTWVRLQTPSGKIRNETLSAGIRQITVELANTACIDKFILNPASNTGYQPAGDEIDNINIIRHPASQAITQAGSANLQTEVTAPRAVTATWYKNGILIPGQQEKTFRITNFQAQDAGSYSATFTMAAATGAPDRLPFLLNGGFEQDPTGESTPGWEFTGNAWTDNGSLYQIPEGIYGFVFNGGENTPNAILKQTIETIPGHTYRLNYKLGIVSFNNSQQVLETRASDSTGTLLATTTITQTPTSNGNPSWAEKTLEFVAAGPQTEIRFTDQSTKTGSTDQMVDDIRLELIPLTTPNIPATHAELVTASTQPAMLGMVATHPITITSLNRLANTGTLTIQTDSVAGTLLQIQASNDLQNWEHVETKIQTENLLDIQDPKAAIEPARFYRVGYDFQP